MNSPVNSSIKPSAHGSPVRVALAGIAGYGDQYVEAILPRQEAVGAKLVGVADPQPNRCKHIKELHDHGVPVHATLPGLFSATPVDLLLIVTPIHLHAQHTMFALQQGASVLCEKPLAGTLQDGLRMLEAQQTAKGFTAIGYQWSFSQAIQALKRDIMAGVLGKPIQMKSLVFFPRSREYFRRNDWVGRICSAAGEGVYDSPANNAAAHYLHNMFYLLGSTRETSAMPASVQAELYRANEIENYDTAAIRCRTQSGVEVLFYTTHAVAERRGPKSRFEFELATVEYDALGLGQFVARFHDGRVRSYGHPNVDRHEKIWQSIEAVQNGASVACGIPAALAHALCVAAAQESALQITPFPQRLRHTVPLDGDELVCVDALSEQLADCYERGVLPVEHPEVTWARGGSVVDLGAPASPRNREGAVTVQVWADKGVKAAGRPS
jgi:predicted dehydrogenase